MAQDGILQIKTYINIHTCTITHANTWKDKWKIINRSFLTPKQKPQLKVFTSCPRLMNLWTEVVLTVNHFWRFSLQRN